MGGVAAEALMGLKRLLRPLVPDSVIGRIKMAQHSRQVRVNVDVVTSRHQRRWLATTPDTYRVRDPAGYGPAPDHDSIVTVGGVPDEGLLRPLADPAVAAAVRAEASPPPRVRGRRTEPSIAPRVVAMRQWAWKEIGPSEDVIAVLQQLRQAGHRLALVPEPPHGGEWRRTDPIALPSAVLLGTVPMHDVGGGSRGTQLALELLTAGYHVTYVALFGTAESHDLGLRHLHPQLEQYRAEEFDPGALTTRATSGRGPVIVEAPAPAFLAAVEGLGGYPIIYDLIDSWSDPALGDRWYRPDNERRLAAAADVLTASAPPLAQHLEALSGRSVVEVPNAVNARLFGSSGPAPADIPPGDGPLFAYHGSLYGEWFDWGALAGVATAYPDARVMVIGDAAHHPRMPPNVHFLGMRPQKQLPDYLAPVDVGIIPFVVDATTHAVSPLKAFEYMALGVPVAAPPLQPLRGLDGVYLDSDLVVAVAAARAGRRPDSARALVEHSWGERLGRILTAGGLEPPAIPGEPTRVILRPAVHYPRSRRLL